MCIEDLCEDDREFTMFDDVIPTEFKYKVGDSVVLLSLDRCGVESVWEVVSAERSHIGMNFYRLEYGCATCIAMEDQLRQENIK